MKNSQISTPTNAICGLREEDHQRDVHALAPPERYFERAGLLEVPDATRQPNDEEDRRDEREQPGTRVERHVARLAEQLPVLVGEERDEGEEQQQREGADEQRERGAEQLEEARDDPPQDREHAEPHHEPDRAQQQQVDEARDERALELTPEDERQHHGDQGERRELGHAELARHREEPPSSRYIQQADGAEDQDDAPTNARTFPIADQSRLIAPRSSSTSTSASSGIALVKMSSVAE